MKNVACSIRISGRVFNVGFRRYVHRYAIENDIVGFVENDYDNDCLHIEAEGEESNVNRFAMLCAEGTPYSMVTEVRMEVKEPTGAFDRFYQSR